MALPSNLSSPRLLVASVTSQDDSDVFPSLNASSSWSEKRLIAPRLGFLGAHCLEL